MVEHLGGRELRLQDRDVVAVAGFAVRTGERVRQKPQPFAQQCVDLGGREALADLLQALGIGAVQDAIVERLKSDALPGELALGVFVAVQAELGVERKVAAELQEKWPEVAVDGINVIIVHHRTAPHDPWVRPSAGRAATPFGAEHRSVLLRLADQHHSFFMRKAAQVFGHHRVLALTLLKLDQRDVMLGHKVFEPRHKASRHRAHQRSRW